MVKKPTADTFWTSGTITIISAAAFICVLLIIMLSNRYMNICVENEAEAQQNRTELRALGEALADGSDYLTDEVRKYAVTGDIEHFYNYWYDVRIARTRDIVIDTLTSCNPPESESELLETAKKYSDLLIETETQSMKMTLLSNDCTAEMYADSSDLHGFVQYVLSYELPEKYSSLSKDKMNIKAIEILFDGSYDNYKNLIMSPIESFQKLMNLRLDNAVAISMEGRKTASLMQIICSVVVLLLISLLLIALYYFYIIPLVEYTESLNSANSDNGNNFLDITKVRINPKGAYELKSFGRLFNKLAFSLKKELENRMAAEAEMRIAKEEADKANNAKSVFLARMSHELRTPLNAIIGYLYLLRQSSLDRKQQRYCEKIGYSSEGLLGLISDILDFSKIESGNMTFENIDFRLMDAINEVYGVMENSVKQKGLQFVLDIDGNLPVVVKGDPTKLRQVIINLLGNAVKFTSEGRITFSVQLTNSDSDRCSIRFSVADTGIGIKDEDKEKILKPFVQSDAGITRKYGGTGLGLAICNMIVSHYSDGEALMIDSEIGKGSCFYFTISFEYGDEKALEPKENDTSIEPIDGQEQVLIVDDNDINLSMESEIIESFGVKTETAISGAEAIKMASGKSYDMILMDIRMPEMDGYETATKIRMIRDYKFVPIIALSADAVAGVSEAVLNAGMNDYVTKPLRPKELYEIMKKYFRIAIEAPQTIETEKSRMFSVNECLNNLGGNKKLLVTLVKRFLTTQVNSAVYAESHIKSGNYGIASRILHDIKGLSGNLCCHILYEKCSVLRDRLQSGGYEQSLAEFMRVWADTIEELKSFAAENEELSRENGKAKMSYPDTISTLTKLCEGYDISAVDFFMENYNCLKENMDRELFTELKNAVDMYNFEEAARLILKEGDVNVQNSPC